MLYKTADGKTPTPQQMSNFNHADSRITEIKSPNDHHCRHMFKLGTRAVFKRFDSTQKGWTK